MNNRRMNSINSLTDFFTDNHSIRYIKPLIVVITYICLSLYITWPLALNPTTTAFNGTEEQLISYIINWNIYALTHKPFDLFNIPFFHPIQNTLAFSDPLITTSILVAPFVLISKEPFLAYTLSTLFAFFANALSTYLLSKELTGDKLSAFIAGLLFSFSIGRIDTLEHLQVLTFYWIPLGLFFFVKYVKRQSNDNALGISLCFMAQVLNTIFLGYVYLFTVTIFYVVALFYKKITFKKCASLFIFGISTLVLVAGILSPYLKVSHDWNYTRTISDAWGGSTVWYEYLYPTNSSRFVNVARAIINKSPWPAYLGFPVSFLSILSFVFALKNRHKLLRSWYVFSALLTAGLGFILSLGPWFRISRQISLPVPLPYLLFFHVIPGFKSMRVPQRWSHLFLFGLSLCIGLAIAEFAKTSSHLNNKVRKTMIIGTCIFILGLVIFEPKWPLMKSSVSSASEVPEVYQWLASQPSQVIMEIPAQHWTMPLVGQEIKRLHYHSFILDAQHAFVNGYSGFSPSAWVESVSSVKKFPQSPSLEVMRQLGVSLVMVHFDDVGVLARMQGETVDAQEMIKQIDEVGDLKLLHESGNSSVYSLKP